jgi:hypothetical protein
MSKFPDTGPLPDGSRTTEQWINAMGEDVGLVRSYVKRSLEGEDDPALMIALALKEARRLQSDLYRFARESLGIGREEIDRQGPL